MGRMAGFNTSLVDCHGAWLLLSHPSYSWLPLAPPGSWIPWPPLAIGTAMIASRTWLYLRHQHGWARTYNINDIVSNSRQQS